MSDWLSEAAPAKVNLSLQITGRAANGYHLLDSLVVFGPPADVLHAASSDGLSLEVVGPFAAGLAAEADNLVLRAARALADWAGVVPRARLRLEKHLPVASGIGGGSADAAAALRVLARLWGVQPGAEALAAIAGGLGADVSVCVGSVAARMSGIGERLGPAPGLPEGGVLLVNPGVAVATADVFRARTGGFSAAVAWPGAWPSVVAMAADLAGWPNDLEPAARSVCPAIGDVLAGLGALPGCRLARMSGSGATCFGLFDDEAAAVAAGGGLPRGWWRQAGPLAARPPLRRTPGPPI